MHRPPPGPARAARVLLGGILAFAGISHLTFARDEFQAQVPDWVPVHDDAVVLVSGLVEIGLGAALIGFARGRVGVRLLAAAFFVAIFPENVAQYVDAKDASGSTRTRSGSCGCSSNRSCPVGPLVDRSMARPPQAARMRAGSTAPRPGTAAFITATAFSSP